MSDYEPTIIVEKVEETVNVSVGNAVEILQDSIDKLMALRPVSVSNEIGLLQDTIDKLNALRPVSIAGGTVDIGNFPASQNINGTVNVGNLPDTQKVSVSNEIGLLQDSIDKILALRPVSVNNFPANQTVSGTVNVGNFPAVQDVNIQGGNVNVSLGGQQVNAQGTVSLSNNTIASIKAVQDVQGSVSVSNLIIVSLNQGLIDSLNQLRAVSVSNLPTVSINQPSIDMLNQLRAVSVSNIPSFRIRGPSGNETEVNANKAAYVSLTGAGDTHQIVDQNGAAKVGEAIVLCGDVWGNILPSANPRQWETEIIGGSGQFLAQPGNLRMETGANTGSIVRMDSKKKARFMGSQFNIFHGGIQMTDMDDPDTTYKFGCFNSIGSSNGGYFQVEGHATDPIWNLVTIKNGVPLAVPQASWTGPDKDSFNPNPNLSVYEIAYNAGSLYYFQGPNLLHVQAVNKIGDTYADSYHFNVGAEVSNGAGTNNSGLQIYANLIYRLGEERGELISRTFQASELIKNGAGYCGHLTLSTAGNQNTEAEVELYDALDDTDPDTSMGFVAVSGNDTKGTPIKSTFTTGLYLRYAVSGGGVQKATVGWE